MWVCTSGREEKNTLPRAHLPRRGCLAAAPLPRNDAPCCPRDASLTGSAATQQRPNRSPLQKGKKRGRKGFLYCFATNCVALASPSNSSCLRSNKGTLFPTHEANQEAGREATPRMEAEAPMRVTSNALR
jgi:hypothetical protein